MLNQTYHFKEFGIKGTWPFFAISDGKSLCDCIGSTIKGLTARESFQQFYEDQILAAEDMKSFAKKKSLE